jgi:hypothetical protein
MADQALLALIAAMQVELNELRQQVGLIKSNESVVTTTTIPASVGSVTSRRRMLRRLSGGIVAGLAMAAVVPENAQARMIVDPVGSDSSRRIGAIVVPPGTASPTGIPNGDATVKYGLVATDGSVSPFDLATLPGFSSGVYGNGYKNGVFGEGGTGVYGTGNGEGNTGVFGIGNTGVTGYGIIGVQAESSIGGISSPALRADHTSATGIAAILNNSSSDTTLLLNNAGAGPLLKAWANGVPKIEFTIGGLIKANGGFQTGGADLAEFISVAVGDAEPALEAGEVVEIDPQQQGLFRRCATAGSLAVVGVISTKPGMTLGASNPAEAENLGPQLALAGRIPVKVCGEGGAIQPGDLLEASSVAGHARRASSPNRPGSILGKALGSLQEGTGIVEMLVMLR